MSVDWPVLDVSHQWNHTLCVFLCLLLSLSFVFSGSIHVVMSSLLFGAEWYSTPCLFGFVPPLAIVSQTAENTHKQVSVWM